LKPAADGKRRLHWDAQVPGLAARVTDKGKITFVLIKRFPGGSRHPVPRKLGEYGRMSLEEARNEARVWLALIDKGTDPAIETERQKQATVRRHKNTLLAVFEDWVRDKLPGERKGKVVERDMRREFIPKLGALPITEITDLDILGIVNAKKRTAPVQARNELGHIKRLFTWAIDQRVYGLKTSPCDSLKPSKIIGRKKSGKRILKDQELFALWRAVKRLSYPYREVYQLLMFTALRLNEAADASWPEFDPTVVRTIRQRQSQPINWTKLKPEQLAWTIPAERMKGKNEDARPHLVPLTPDVLQILALMPLFKKGDYLFTTTCGEKPVWIGDKIKKEIDARILRTLRALARQRGDDPAKVEVAPWVNHDIRRTIRSNLSRLRVTEEAHEAVLAHARSGIKSVYDLHDYFDEKREALELWAARLRSIVEPASTGNIINFKQARSSVGDSA
jgi:hypothetical protein